MVVGLLLLPTLLEAGQPRELAARAATIKIKNQPRDALLDPPYRSVPKNPPILNTIGH